MIDKEFREALNRLGEEKEQSYILLDNEAYDNSIIGITEDGRVVYDYNLMVMELADDYRKEWIESHGDIMEDMDDIPDFELDAVEWIDYNTLIALDYYSEPNKPIIICATKEAIKNDY